MLDDPSVTRSESQSASLSVVSHSLRPHGLHSPWDSPGQNTGVGTLSLLQGSFPTQESNSGLLHSWLILFQLSYHRSPKRWKPDTSSSVICFLNLKTVYSEYGFSGPKRGERSPHRCPWGLITRGGRLLVTAGPGHACPTASWSFESPGFARLPGT